MKRGRVESITIQSEVLKTNPLGDPWERELLVYLPPDYSESSRGYPVVYMLAGFSGTGRSFLNFQPWQPNIAERMDRLISHGVPPAILVMPDCFTSFGGSQYINSTATGMYEDHLITEVVPLVDSSFNTLPGRDHRGIMGKSSGGYGALVLGMRHPDVFSAVACHSGDMYFELCYKPDFPKFVSAIERAGGLEVWWQQFNDKPKKSGSDFEAVNILAMAAAYSPDPNKPLGIDFPFDLRTCQLRDDVWQRWLENDPVYMVDRYADSLRSLKLLFLDCGFRDQYNLHFGARILTSRLEELGVPYEYEEFDDNHSNTSYRYDVSLPKVIQALAEQDPGGS